VRPVNGTEAMALSLASKARELRLREIRADDCEGMANVSGLHMELLSYGPMAGLGELFIREAIYRPHVSDGSLRVALYTVDDAPAGFVAYTDRAIGFHRDSLRRHWARTAGVLALALAQDPRRIVRLLRSIRVLLSRRGEQRLGTDPMAEVVCVAVRPAFVAARFARESGRRVSEDLIRYAADRLRELGLRELRMLVDADNREVLFLYHALGARFERYEQAGEPMFNVWFDLQSGPLANPLMVDRKLP
jgi:ribosomal protein S18 acetylase RimI-like enzyme